MESLSIKGGVPLRGEVTISGAKNAALPIMAATLLTTEPCVIRRVPNLSDVTFMAQILTSLGAKVKFDGDTLTLHAGRIKGVGDYDLIRKMRGSICILGPLVGRLRRASVSLPGGCVIGPRPIDLHLKGLSKLGARITIKGGYVRANAPRLTGGDERRSHLAGRAPRPHARRFGQIARGGRESRAMRHGAHRETQRAFEAGGHYHAAVRRIPDGRAGANDGADDAHARHQHHHRA